MRVNHRGTEKRRYDLRITPIDADSDRMRRTIASAGTRSAKSVQSVDPVFFCSCLIPISQDSHFLSMRERIPAIGVRPTPVGPRFSYQQAHTPPTEVVLSGNVSAEQSRTASQRATVPRAHPLVGRRTAKRRQQRRKILQINVTVGIGVGHRCPAAFCPSDCHRAKITKRFTNWHIAANVVFAATGAPE